MKSIGASIIKDIIISVLFVLAIVLILSVIFYDKISLTKVIPEAEEYQLSEEMQQDLEDENLEEAQEVITTYYIDAADLKKYERTKEYNKGKKNPFAAESVSENNTISTNNNTNDDNEDSSSNSTNFYEDDGTK